MGYYHVIVLSFQLLLTLHMLHQVFTNLSKCQREALPDPRLADAFHPTCNSDGSYTKKQCYVGSFSQCWCVDTQTGIEIPNTRREAGMTLHCDAGPCHTKKSAMSNGLIGAHIPQCNRDGTYKEKQCHASTGYCWCVERETGSIINGTKKGPTEGEVTCETTTPSPIPYMHFGKIYHFQSKNYPARMMRHRNFEVWIDERGANNGNLYEKDTSFLVVPGLAGKGVSFRSLNFPDRYLRHQNWLCYIHVDDGSQLFKNDSSFIPHNGLASSNDSLYISFESVNYPGYYIRHSDFRVKINSYENTPLFRQDASWLPIRISKPQVQRLKDALHVRPQCPMERGFCVKKDGDDQNSGVKKFNSLDGNTVERQKNCLAKCLAIPHATGCEVIWSQANRGCYVHTKDVARGNNYHRHRCWIFSKCKSPMRDVTICEHQRKTISCQTNTVIKIISANYGRLSHNVCRSSAMSNTNCRAHCSMKKVVQSCGGKRSCSLLASNSVFGDPCYGTFKYLHVVYKCVRQGKARHDTTEKDALHARLQCPMERGFCVMKNGGDQNLGVKKFNSLDGNTVERQKICLAKCLAIPHATGCEVIWSQLNRGCYVHTKDVARGNNYHRHRCWIFSKCKRHMREVTICEHQRKRISCRRNEVIIIKRANYGRLSPNVCRSSPRSNTNCRARCSMRKVIRSCGRKRSCSLFASNSVFGDPCRGTFKYLHVEYKCVRRGKKHGKKHGKKNHPHVAWMVACLVLTVLLIVILVRLIKYRQTRMKTTPSTEGHVVETVPPKLPPDEDKTSHLPPAYGAVYIIPHTASSEDGVTVIPSGPPTYHTLYPSGALVMPGTVAPGRDNLPPT